LPDGTLNTLAPIYGDVITIPSPLGFYRIHGKNRWSSTGSDFARLPQRIEDRRKEVAVMQEHARKRGVSVPAGDALDHEIAFINYRLMAKKLGLEYAGHGQDSPGSLLGKAYAVLRAERYPLKLSLTHAVWFGVLAIAPAGAARELIRFRFQRNTAGVPYKRTLLRLLRSLNRAASNAGLPVADLSPHGASASKREMTVQTQGRR
jgi:hypothetical protein